MRHATALAVVLMSALPAAHAAQDGWTGDASVGYLGTSGNTDTRTLNTKGTAAYRKGLWGHTMTVLAVNGSRNNLTTDERYGAGYKATYDIAPNQYVFGSLNYDNDRFAGIAQRTTEALGYGQRLLALSAHTLDAEIGAGATQTELRTGEQQNSAVAVGNAKYLWTISPTASFGQTLKIERSERNTYVNPVSTLKLQVVGNLFTTLGYEVRHNSTVPAGLRKTDTLTSVNLGYSFP